MLYWKLQKYRWQADWKHFFCRSVCSKVESDGHTAVFLVYHVVFLVIEFSRAINRKLHVYASLSDHCEQNWKVNIHVWVICRLDPVWSHHQSRAAVRQCRTSFEEKWRRRRVSEIEKLDGSTFRDSRLWIFEVVRISSAFSSCVHPLGEHTSGEINWSRVICLFMLYEAIKILGHRPLPLQDLLLEWPHEFCLFLQ